ncbi:phosphoribosylamine--glycine ligase [Nocardia carnea]|uniref:phosphoribosylamine--glycine ligase n=1 Tax=Nocardia carnea TaxID=37328 RepID=UPI0002FB97C2|nr:phosphoribosylamine--glycine ligase [Nocardia carnea]
MKILVIGSGGREHAIVAALSRDPDVTALHAGPGNPGIAAIAACHPVDPCDGAAVAALATALGVDLVIIGPEAPLIAGVADAVRAADIACFGPTQDAARIEGSKGFAKDVMNAAGIPTARARTCTTSSEVDDALTEFGAPYVVKDDGLAAGKGVMVTDNIHGARAHAAGCDRVVIEEYLDGREFSMFALCDGTRSVAMALARDYKRVGDGDLGPNTGGMGAYSPVPWIFADLEAELTATVVTPVLEELQRRGAPFAGVLFPGLILTDDGVKVIEYNARFGDPEIQVVLERLNTPLSGLLYACATGTLKPDLELDWSPDTAVNVVIASDGYPAQPVTGDPIGGLDHAAAIDGVHVLHAGTALDDSGAVITAGGRVINVVARAADPSAARAAAYEVVDRIELRGKVVRTDIATDLMR